MAFHDILRQLRKENNLTQAALAVKINTNVRTIRHYEAGTSAPSITALAKIADFFKVNTDFLLDRTDDPTPLLPAEAIISRSITRETPNKNDALQ